MVLGGRGYCVAIVRLGAGRSGRAYNSRMFKEHYRKVIIACGFLFVFVNLGLASTAFSVHQPYIVAIPGVGDTGGLLILSVRMFTSLVSMLFVDRYYEALDVRRGVFLMSVSVCIGFIVFSMASSLPLFMFGAIFMGLGYGMGGAVALTFLANRWFSSGIGSAVGIGAMGSGVASILMPLLVVRIINASSLSTAFLVEAGVSLAIGVVVYALIRNRPSDLGLEPFEGSAAAKAKRIREMAPASRGERRLLMVAIVFVGIFGCCGMTYLSVLATSTGFDPVFAALLVSIAGTTMTISKFVAGRLFDRLGAPRASFIIFSIAFIGFALCCTANRGIEPLMIVGAVAVGSGLTLGTVGLSVWSIDLSGPRTRTKQIKNFQVAYAFGGFIANTLPGIVKDLVGSYVVSYAAMVVLIAVAAFIILRFYWKFEKRLDVTA